MNIHKNARLTVKSRQEMVEGIEKRQFTIKQAVELFRVSRRTVQKWLRRFREEGLAGLFDRKSAPKTCPHKIAASEAEAILSLRSMGLLGVEIAERVGRCRTTVSNVLRGARLSKQKQLDEDPNPRRYEHPNPGDMLHIDIKKFGKFAQPGHRVMKRSDKRYKPSGKGHEYAHVCIDDHSRYSYVEILDEGETASATSGFLRRAVEHFARLGVDTKRVLSDNGPGYRSRDFRAAVEDLAISHSRTRPYSPKTNGKAERFIQSLQREWAYVREYESSEKRKELLPSWIERYNHQRPHGGIGGKPPCSRI